MKTPFTTGQFFEVFERYNETVFPFQLVIIALGIAGLYLLHSKWSAKSKLIGAYLGGLWIWMGVVYHIIFFAEINTAAYAFGGMFILQGLLILYYSFIGKKLFFSFSFQARDYIGYFFIIFGLIIYPVVGYFIENSFARTISLGLPCPTTIMTFGFFMLSREKFPRVLLIIPLLWAVIGLSAVFNFGVYQDMMILVSALVAAYFLFRKKDSVAQLEVGS